MIKHAALSLKRDGEKIILVQRVRIFEFPPKGICGSRIQHGSVEKPRSSTCHDKPNHATHHQYRLDMKPTLLYARKMVLAKFKGQSPRFLGWFDGTQTLNNSSDVQLEFNGRKYVR